MSEPDNTDACAARIKSYWEKRGHQVEINIVRMEVAPSARTPFATTLSIRSDMKNGKPTTLVCDAPAGPLGPVRAEKLRVALRDSHDAWRVAGLAHLVSASADSVLAELREMRSAGLVESLVEGRSGLTVWRWKRSGK